MDKKEELFNIIDRGMSYSKNDIEIFISSEKKENMRFSNSQLKKNEIIEDTIATITLYNKNRKATVKTNIINENGIMDAIKIAEINLEFMPVMDINFRKKHERKYIINEEFDENLYEKFNIINRTKSIKDSLERLPEEFKASGAFCLSTEVIAIGDSSGIKRYGRIDKVSLNLIVSHISGASGYIEYGTNKSNEMDISNQFNMAYTKAKEGINPVKVDVGVYTVILEPLALSDLLTYTSYYCFSAKSIQDGKSFLTGKIGKKIFSDNVSIIDDVTNKNTFSFPFDFQGYERKKVEIIDHGYVKGVVYDLESAILDKTITTGHSINDVDVGGYACNIVMENGDLSKEELIKSVKDGILISRFHYLDIMDSRKGVFSALLRDGAFLIKNGKVIRGIKDVRITDTLENLFNNITSISKERQKVQNFIGVNYVPSVKVKNINITHSC